MNYLWVMLLVSVVYFAVVKLFSRGRSLRESDIRECVVCKMLKNLILL